MPVEMTPFHGGDSRPGGRAGELSDAEVAELAAAVLCRRSPEEIAAQDHQIAARLRSMGRRDVPASDGELFAGGAHYAADWTAGERVAPFTGKAGYSIENLAEVLVDGDQLIADGHPLRAFAAGVVGYLRWLTGQAETIRFPDGAGTV